MQITKGEPSIMVNSSPNSLMVEREKRYPNYTLIGYYTGFAIRFAT